MNTDNIVMWVTRLNIVDWVSSKTMILLATLRTQNQPRGRVLCIFEIRAFVPISSMCKKQTSVSHSSTDKTSVSHSSTETDVISLDAGLRMDGLPALDLCDVVIEVLHSSNNRKSSTKRAADTACTCLIRS